MSASESSPKPFPVVIVTGLSGSGKSTALSVLEDMGFFTVDGLPSALAPQMLEMISKADLPQCSGVAFGMDLRQNDFLSGFEVALESMQRLDRKSVV